MKKLLYLLALLLLLTACAKQNAPVPEPEPDVPPVQAEVQLPEPQPKPEPIPEPEQAPEPKPAPEKPVAEGSNLPDLPYPAYCWGDTAVAKDGTVILQVPDHTLELCFDAITGKPAGFLAQSDYISMFLPTAFYSLDGQPVLTDLPLAGFQTTGDLYWFLNEGGWTLRRFSDGTVLADGMRMVDIAGDYLLTQAMFWNAPCLLIDRVTGETVLELDRGFQLSQVFRDGGNIYLSMKSVVDDTVNLVDLQGTPRLDGFHEKILRVTQNCAIVTDSAQNRIVYSAIDLETGTVLFRRNQPFDLLPDGILASLEAGTQILDRQEQPLNDTIFGIAYPCDPDSDGDPDLILGSPMNGDPSTTIVMQPDGTELATIPTQERYVTPLTPTQIIYSVFTGKEALQVDVRLLDLDKGSDILLTTGNQVDTQAITTSGGRMILCGGRDFQKVFLNDGTPTIPDLGTGQYIGGDVFSCEEGLRCLDGTWLYKQEP